MITWGQFKRLTSAELQRDVIARFGGEPEVVDAAILKTLKQESTTGRGADYLRMIDSLLAIDGARPTAGPSEAATNASPAITEPTSRWAMSTAEPCPVRWRLMSPSTTAPTAWRPATGSP